MTRVIDDFNEGKFSKQHLGMIMCLSPNVFIKFGVERLNTLHWKVRYFCVLNIASLDHYFVFRPCHDFLLLC
jgi:hypothetical protein